LRRRERQQNASAGHLRAMRRRPALQKSHARAPPEHAPLSDFVVNADLKTAQNAPRARIF
jgi:hypothetical protein